MVEGGREREKGEKRKEREGENANAMVNVNSGSRSAFSALDPSKLVAWAVLARLQTPTAENESTATSGGCLHLSEKKCLRKGVVTFYKHRCIVTHMSYF